MSASTPQWSSRLAFYLATVGGAVGLGSIWRMPYLAGSNGGSAFIFVFVLACLMIATPLLVAEFMIGRRAQCSPPEAAGVVAAASGLSTRWNLIGILGTIAAFAIISYYTVIAGWVLAYTWKCASGALVGLSRPDVAALWKGFLGNPVEIGAWHLAFVALVGVISARGVGRGVGRAAPRRRRRHRPLDPLGREGRRRRHRGGRVPAGARAPERPRHVRQIGRAHV